VLTLIRRSGCLQSLNLHVQVEKLAPGLVAACEARLGVSASSLALFFRLVAF
jgi:hypothetical protein